MPRQEEIQKTKDGMCRRIAARFDAHHRRRYERRSHDTPREVCCSSSAYQFKGGVFQTANSYQVSIVAKSPRGCAEKLGGGKRCRADERPSGAEEVVEGHFGLNNAGMRVAQETHRRHQCQMNRRPRSRQLLEGPGFQRGKQHSPRRYSTISVSTPSTAHSPADIPRNVVARRPSHPIFKTFREAS